MRKWGAFAVGIVLALAVASPAHAASVERHRYVANDFGSFMLASVSQSTGTAVDGTVLFKSQSDHVVLTVADRVATGTVPVIINTADGRRAQCVPVGHATRIGGLVAGEWAAFTLLDATYHGECHSGATVGMLTIRL
ncbi:MAG: hypothetical protein QOK28_3675 [Actinomycetota bacterium]|jgi:hypothetical protein